jgi:hypothetical protein
VIERKSGQERDSASILSKLPSSFKIVNISDSPRYTSSEFDIIDELVTNRQHYTAGEGDPTLSLQSLPVMCTINVERLRDTVVDQGDLKRKPGLHATLSACVYYGCTSLMDNENISSLLTAKTKLNLVSPDIDSRIIEIVNGMFSQYSLTANLPKGKRYNLFIPNHIHAPLASLANDLSSDVSRVHLQSLSILAIMHTLSLQPDTLEDHGDKMKLIVGDFIESVRYLNRAVRAVIKEFKL